MTLRMFFFLAAVSTSLFGATSSIIFSESWGNHFGIRVTEQGETLTIGAMTSSNDRLLLYDVSNGSVVAIDPISRAVITTVHLASIGRGTYQGDDFVARDTELIFLNSIDKRLERFDMKSGAYRGSIPYPVDQFKKQSSRSLRLINRLFVDNERIVFGNSQRLAYLEENNGLHKSSTAQPTLATKPREKFLIFGNGRIIMQTGNALVEEGIQPVKPIRSPKTISGKQYAIVKESLFAVTVSGRGIQIIKVK